MSGLEATENLGKKVQNHSLQLWQALKLVRDEGAKLVSSLKTGVRDHLQASLSDVCTQVKERMGGLPEGASWKASVSSDRAQWKEVVKAASSMMSGGVIKTLMKDFKLLQKDPCFVCGLL